MGLTSSIIAGEPRDRVGAVLGGEVGRNVRHVYAGFLGSRTDGGPALAILPSDQEGIASVAVTYVDSNAGGIVEVVRLLLSSEPV